VIDTHCHLSHPDFDPDREEVVARSWASGVSAILEVGYSVETSEAAVRLSRAHPEGIRAAVGIHPHEAGRAGDPESRAIEALSRAGGGGDRETRLDFYRRWARRTGRSLSSPEP
jgi:TatD DNase family protein